VAEHADALAAEAPEAADDRFVIAELAVAGVISSAIAGPVSPVCTARNSSIWASISATGFSKSR
jgi:hypothetical protein